MRSHGKRCFSYLKLGQSYISSKLPTINKTLNFNLLIRSLYSLCKVINTFLFLNKLHNNFFNKFIIYR